MSNSIIAITMGDPSGIGPEIILRAFMENQFPPVSQIIVIGDKKVLSTYAEKMGCLIPLQVITNTQDIQTNTIPIIETPPLSSQEWEIGTISAAAGDAAFSYITKSIELAQAGIVDAVVTAPINKEALHAAGHTYPGHTEIFAEKCDIDNYTMLFRVEGISVVHVTTHCSLRQALDKLSTPLVLKNIHLLQETLLSLGIKKPRIAVAGINPHAGENGLFGTEEIEIINPAIRQAQDEGLDIAGPYPPDTVFMQAFKGQFDGIVAMLHDHGFVALKSRDFEKGVNITIGLPIIRTSVGHGTAFDIAGKGIADTYSLHEAIDAAHAMIQHKKQQTKTSKKA